VNLEQITSELKFSAVRSRGPGGQNVNKVSSAAVLYWDFNASSALNDEQKYLIRKNMKNVINKEAFVYLRSDEFRDLEKNKSRCIEKLEAMLIQAFHKPKARRPTKPTRNSKLRKLESKNRRGELKQSRQKIR